MKIKTVINPEFTVKNMSTYQRQKITIQSFLERAFLDNDTGNISLLALQEGVTKLVEKLYQNGGLTMEDVQSIGSRNYVHRIED